MCGDETSVKIFKYLDERMPYRASISHQNPNDRESPPFAMSESEAPFLYLLYREGLGNLSCQVLMLPKRYPESGSASK